MVSLIIYFSGLILTLLLVFCAQKMSSNNLSFSWGIKNGVVRISSEFILIILAFIPLWYIISFRDMSVGRDAYGTQYNIFRHVAYGSFYDYKNYGSEVGYFWLNRICAFFSDSYHLVLIVTGSLSWGLFYKYIIDNSSSPVFSILIFFLSFGYFHQFNIMRQFIACGIILYGFKYIKERKLIAYLITVMIAFSFHRIAVIGIVFYILYGIKINTRIGIMIVLCSKVLLGSIRDVVGSFLAGTRYYSIFRDPRAYESGYMILEIILSILIYIFAILVERNCDGLDSRDFNFNIWLSVIALIITLNSNVLPIPYRILWYVNLNNIVFVPQMIGSITKKKNVSIAKCSVLGVYFAYFSYEWITGVDAIQHYMLWKDV